MRKKRLHIHKRPIYNLLGECIGYEAPQKGIKIIECEKAFADRIVAKHHYSHKAPKNAFVSLVVLYHNKLGGGTAMRLRHSPQNKRQLQCRTGKRVRPNVALRRYAKVQRDNYTEFIPPIHAPCPPRGKGADKLCRYKCGE